MIIKFFSLIFQKTDDGKTKSNEIELPSNTLPKGGGAIKSIDEKFSVNPVNARQVLTYLFLYLRHAILLGPHFP
jgi:hypothetical protein